VVYGDLIIAAGNREDPRALRLKRNDKAFVAEEVWRAQRLPLHMTTPVIAGDLLIGVSSRKRGCFFCLDARTGKTLWETSGRLEGTAAVVNAGNVWLTLTSQGKLMAIRPNAREFDLIAEYDVADPPIYAHPVFLGNQILIRGATTLRSYGITPVEPKAK
jgi:outer membrane protein assembly factor BamB